LFLFNFMNDDARNHEREDRKMYMCGRKTYTCQTTCFVTGSMALFFLFEVLMALTMKITILRDVLCYRTYRHLLSHCKKMIVPL
jgi:hypothetical protein